MVGTVTMGTLYSSAAYLAVSMDFPPPVPMMKSGWNPSHRSNIFFTLPMLLSPENSLTTYWIPAALRAGNSFSLTEALDLAPPLTTARFPKEGRTMAASFHTSVRQQYLAGPDLLYLTVSSRLNFPIAISFYPPRYDLLTSSLPISSVLSPLSLMAPFCMM